MSWSSVDDIVACSRGLELWIRGFTLELWSCRSVVLCTRCECTWGSMSCGTWGHKAFSLLLSAKRTI